MSAAYHSWEIEGEKTDKKLLKRYGEAVMDLYRNATQRDFILSPAVIQEFHKRWYGKGAFRTHYTRPGTSPHLIEVELTRLCDWLQWKRELQFSGYSPLTWQDMALFHHDFETIHPFEDGNGRTGRGLLAAVAVWMGVAPPIIRGEWREQYISAMMYGDIPTLATMLERGSRESGFPKTVPFRGRK